MEQQLRSIEHELQSLSGEELNARLETYNRLQSQFESQNGYACESEIIGVLKGLGFTEEEFSKKTDTLSGPTARTRWGFPAWSWRASKTAS